jgi:spermidine synthase
MQSLDPSRRGEALTYFHRTGPFGQAFAAVAPPLGARIGVVGLGVGTLATYAQPGQQWTFYEIDPAAERIARTPAFFTYLTDCGSRCGVVLGDARVSLAADPAVRYDLIVLDAFTSDAIPVHLMTHEAMSMYLTRLAPHGVIAFHISSQHLKLAPVVARLAGSLDLVAIENVDRKTAGPWAEGKSESHWVVLARSREDLRSLKDDPRWIPLVPAAATPLWTDDFSNILGVIRFR